MCTFHDKKDKHDRYRDKDCKKNIEALEKPKKACDGNNQLLKKKWYLKHKKKMK